MFKTFRYQEHLIISSSMYDKTYKVSLRESLNLFEYIEYIRTLLWKLSIIDYHVHRILHPHETHE